MLCCLRRETAFSPESVADLIEVLPAILRGEAQIVGGVLELAYYRATGDGGQPFPTTESVARF